MQPSKLAQLFVKKVSWRPGFESDVSPKVTAFAALGKVCKVVNMKIDSLDKFLCVILPFFSDLVADKFGQGLLLLTLSMAGTVLAYASLESLKVGRPFFLGPWTPMIIFAVGQLTGIGVALPAIYIPLYALAKTFEVSFVFHI